MKSIFIVSVLRLIVFIVCVVTVNDATATSVDAFEARNKALQFLNNRQVTLMSSPQQLKLVCVEVSKTDVRHADYYIFNSDDCKAFVIVAGDDRAVDVLAYGAHAIDMDDVTCNMQWLLDHYKKQINFLCSHTDIQQVKGCPHCPLSYNDYLFQTYDDLEEDNIF